MRCRPAGPAALPAGGEHLPRQRAHDVETAAQRRRQLYLAVHRREVRAARRELGALRRHQVSTLR